MFTELLVVALFCLSLFLMYVWPVMRHFLKYRKERELLEKKFNRLWKSRNDLLVSVTCSSQTFFINENNDFVK